MCAEVMQNKGLVLPTEVLEMVLAQLPLTDLLTIDVTVCRYWYDVIRNPAFIPWKKVYHRLKLAPASEASAFLLSPSRVDDKLPVTDIISALCQHHGCTSLRDCLISVVRLMGNTQRIPTGDATKCVLEKHELYSVAMDALENMEEALVPRPFNIWHVTTMIVLLSHDVWHVDALLQLLLHQGSMFTSCNVVEAFYCLATFFFYSTQKFELPTRYHYLVYYALYLYENRWTTKPSHDPGDLQHEHVGQQSIHKYINLKSSVQHTHEQMRIINHNIEPSHVVKIVAFAGTGKTTTLLQMCKQRPHQRFLLVVYNKSVEEHCSKTFPGNVKVKTAHAMAFASVGKRYSAIRKLDGSLAANKIANFLQERERGGNRFRRAALVKNTVERFLNSADDYLTLQHVPTVDKHNVALGDDYRLRILLPDAESVWEEMKKCSNKQEISMTQDGQLKMWQLKKPHLLGYDVVMIDEGQDMNAAMFDIFLSQNCAKIVVGDPYQQIYSFRGAVNALDRVMATHTFYLTQSFRFGPEVAYVAHCVLESLLGVHRQTIVGGRKKDTIVEVPDARSYVTQPKLKRAYLARTNLEIYKLSIKICEDEEFKSASMAFAGGIKKYGFGTVMDVYKLSQVETGFGTAETLQIHNKLIAKFKSVSSLAKFAENLDDHELYNKIMMFKYSGFNTPNHINMLKKRCNADQSVADIMFSTIHKAKGLEWEWVVLMDDLLPINIIDGPRFSANAGDEHNLLYVSITRAKKYLTINSAALYTMIKARDKLEVLVPKKSIDVAMKCLQCASSTVADSKYPVVTKVPAVSISYDGDVFHGGYFCNVCTSFDKFVPPITSRHSDQNVRYQKDYSRISRLMLITGKQHFLETESTGPMERGWHQYALRPRQRRLRRTLYDIRLDDVDLLLPQNIGNIHEIPRNFDPPAIEIIQID
nr:F-box DNA helicase 1-like isoform X1 [Procambarus clarkii]